MKENYLIKIHPLASLLSLATFMSFIKYFFAFSNSFCNSVEESIGNIIIK